MQMKPSPSSRRGSHWLGIAHPAIRNVSLQHLVERRREAEEATVHVEGIENTNWRGFLGVVVVTHQGRARVRSDGTGGHYVLKQWVHAGLWRHRR